MDKLFKEYDEKEKIILESELTFKQKENEIIALQAEYFGCY
jgi:hypothetical protein